MIMRYDASMLRERTIARRREFIIKQAIALALSAISILLISIFFGKLDTVVLISGVLCIASGFYTARLLREYTPFILFSGEVRGVNIKESEYVANIKHGSPKIYRRINAPDTHANKKISHPNLRGSVYIRQENGNIYEAHGLSIASINIYKDGDTLIKPEGAKYPQIVNRKCENQPCPLCGEINFVGSKSCHGCGLLIISDHKNQKGE